MTVVGNSIEKLLAMVILIVLTTVVSVRLMEPDRPKNVKLRLVECVLGNVFTVSNRLNALTRLNVNFLTRVNSITSMVSGTATGKVNVIAHSM